MAKDTRAPLRPTARQLAARQTLEAAIAAIEAGRFDDAEGVLRSNADALQLPIGQNILGDVHLKTGKVAEALKAFDAAIRLAPQMPEAHCNRAAALQELRRYEDALAAADRAIRLRPQYATAAFNRGNALRDLMRHEQAVEAYTRAVALKPAFAEALLNRGHVRLVLGKWLDALGDFNKVLGILPDSVGAHMGRAGAFRGLHDFPAAFAALDAALAIEPDNLDIAAIRADVLISAERYDEALAAIEAALVVEPNAAAAHVLRARALHELKRHEESLAAADDAVRVSPRSPAAHVARATALTGLEQEDEAIDALASAEKLGATGAVFFHTRGVTLTAIGRATDGIPWLERAIALEPKSASFNYSLAFALLKLGRLEEAWPRHEWRLKRREHGHAETMAMAPQWQGESFVGKKLLVYAEQGHGDSIQFTRYLPMAMERGGAITLHIQDALRRLYEDNFPGIDIASRLGMRSGYDHQISLMSLAAVFGTRLDTVPANVPYLKADENRAAKWRERLGREGFRIGIVWQGNPKYGADRHRSFTAREFAPLAAVDGVRLISLQWTGGADRLGDLARTLRLETLGEEIENNPDGFREVAAVMANLDLLVMSDTGPAHLAGAMGRPVWVALTRNPDWRWMSEGDTTPWYPTMRLFRQKTRGDWPSVFGEIAAKVEGLLAARRQA